MSKGQQAMALAMIYPETKQGKKSEAEHVRRTNKLSKDRLSCARAVLHYSQQLAQGGPCFMRGKI